MSTSAKVTARQRIENLLDDNSFVEIGAYVKARNTDFNIQAKDTPSDGVITGYGVIKCFRTDLYEAVTCIRSNPNSYSYFR